MADALRNVGAIIVSHEPDRAVIAFYEDADLSAFHEALQQYSAGPRSGINPQTQKPYESTKWDVFGYIQADQMRNWNREDRIGLRLREEIAADGTGIDRDRLYYLDVEFWPRGQQQARADLAELRRLLQGQPHPEERIHDEFAGDLMCLARVAITGAKLDTLLNLSSVAEVDRPPQPTFDTLAAAEVTPAQFPTPAAPPEDGPRVCVVDSGITSNHPLLRNHVGHEEAILTETESAADENGHGTRVGGVAVFGDVRAAYDAGMFMSEVTLFSARVLNDQNEFDQRRLVEKQMEAAIKTFAAPPYNCRVFNISIGDRTPLLRGAGDRQGRWAEALDRLMREHGVLIFVAAGNHRLAGARRPDDAEQVLHDYPEFLFHLEAGLCEPATAALAVTVGSLAQYDVAAIRRGSQEHDIVRPVARRNEPSPFTRIGPGVNGAVKPEFVDYGGNVGFDGTGSSRRFIHDEIPDPGLAVMSLSSQPLQKLFGYGIGTSYAAPHLARLAARLWLRLRDDLGQEPHPNLVRAVLASSAEVPDEAKALLDPHGGDKAIRRVCGYGLPDEDLAFNSTDWRVTLVAQAAQRIDTITLYEIPIPTEMIEARGRKRVIVSLAFDPPVRRRRANYLGVEMQVDLLRGKSPDEIEAAYRAVSKEERKTAPKSFQDRHLCKLEPGPQAVESSTLHRREWSFRRGDLNDGDTYYLMVRSFRNWAPDEITDQDYALAVTLEAEDERLYNLISQRVRQRPRIRV
ncbi:MAG: S8 family peptidase [Armatimonadota bacterium]